MTAVSSQEFRQSGPHNTTHREKPSGPLRRESCECGSLKALQCHLQAGRGYLILSPASWNEQTSKNLSQENIRFSFFTVYDLRYIFLVNLCPTVLGLSRDSSQQGKTTSFFFTHKDKTCRSLLYTFLMQEEYRSAWISRPCSLNPLCRRFQGSQLYCVSTHSWVYPTIPWFSASLCTDENST